jgi:flagellar biosynthesis/type III secretory pathway protein FliH
MSDLLSAPPGAAARPASQRPARVWQALDLLQPQAAAGKFEANSWNASAVPLFGVTDFSLLPDESAHDAAHRPIDSMPQAVAAEPDIQDDAVAVDPQAAVSAEAVAQARLEGHAQGVAETRAAMQAEMEQTLETRLSSDQSLLTSLHAALAVLQQSPDIYFEPLKRLALHLAEQLVMAELNLDGHAIERLVRACVDELSLNNESVILVELHPDDLAAWEDLRQRSGVKGTAGLRLQANDALAQGSVRASANHTQVEDLIADRLAGLASALGLHEQRWRANSAFHPDRADSQQAAAIQQPHPHPHDAALDSPPVLTDASSNRPDSPAADPSDKDLPDVKPDA